MPRVYLDVEGIPDRDFYYLVGVVVEADGQCSAHSFWADNETEEQAIWVKLLDLLRDLGDCTLFHYGAYEKAYVKKMMRKYPSSDSPFSGTWDSALFNVLGAIRTNVYFPAYSNGLKDIASYLGVSWTGKVRSGIDCIAARTRWEQSRDSVIKEEIVDYNRQDCVAVQRVADFLLSLGSSERTATLQVQLASEVRVDSHGKFGSTDFAIPEMSYLNKCARFNYQRDKVLVRTDPSVRASARRKQARSRAIMKPNVEFRCEPRSRCPFCGSDLITSFRRVVYSKIVYDLKVTKRGVKRWIIRYASPRNQCLDCLKTFYSETYPTHQQTGHSLASWAVYHHVALRLSFKDVALSINDLFGYCFAVSRSAGVLRLAWLSFTGSLWIRC